MSWRGFMSFTHPSPVPELSPRKHKRRVSFASPVEDRPSSNLLSTERDVISNASHRDSSVSPRKRRFSIVSLEKYEWTVQKQDRGVSPPKRRNSRASPPTPSLDSASYPTTPKPHHIRTRSRSNSKGDRDSRSRRDSAATREVYTLNPPPSPRKRKSSIASSTTDTSGGFYQSPSKPYTHLSPTELKIHRSTPALQARPKPDLSITVPHSPRKAKYTVIQAPSNRPPPEICSEVNNRVRSAFNNQNSFDFAEHVQHRSYVVRSLPLERGECVVMLDTGVDALLPTAFSLPQDEIDVCKLLEIRDAPGKGLGMFARKGIKNGDVILVEHPTILTPYVIGLSAPLSEIYVDMFGRLSPEVFGELMALSSASTGKGTGYVAEAKAVKGNSDVHEAIMRVNALAIRLPVPHGEFAELETHRGIFMLTSRCNHSCGPNAKWEWDPKTFSLTLTALRPIAPYEEITIPYISSHLSYKQRQETLLSTYGFHCICTFCTRPKDFINQGDGARQTLQAIWDRKSTPSSMATNPQSLPTFEQWCLTPTYHDDLLINAHKEALNLIHLHGLEILDSGPDAGHPGRDVGRHLDAIAMCYGALEDVEEFRVWIGRAGEERERERPGQRLAFRKWLSNPIAFPVWGWRRAIREGRKEGRRSDGTTGLAASLGMFDFI